MSSQLLAPDEQNHGANRGTSVAHLHELAQVASCPILRHRSFCRYRPRVSIDRNALAAEKTRGCEAGA
jgi:hypothetical protein